MIGHVAGGPVEELLVPFLASGGAMFLVATRVAVSRRWRRPGLRPSDNGVDASPHRSVTGHGRLQRAVGMDVVINDLPLKLRAGEAPQNHKASARARCLTIHSRDVPVGTG